MKRHYNAIGWACMLASIPFAIWHMATQPDGLPLDYKLALTGWEVSYIIGVYFWGRSVGRKSVQQEAEAAA